MFQPHVKFLKPRRAPGNGWNSVREGEKMIKGSGELDKVQWQWETEQNRNRRRMETRNRERDRNWLFSNLTFLQPKIHSISGACESYGRFGPSLSLHRLLIRPDAKSIQSATLVAPAVTSSNSNTNREENRSLFISWADFWETDRKRDYVLSFQSLNSNNSSSSQFCV